MYIQIFSCEYVRVYAHQKVNTYIYAHVQMHISLYKYTYIHISLYIYIHFLALRLEKLCVVVQRNVSRCVESIFVFMSM